MGDYLMPYLMDEGSWDASTFGESVMKILHDFWAALGLVDKRPSGRTLRRREIRRQRRQEAINARWALRMQASMSPDLSFREDESYGLETLFAPPQTGMLWRLLDKWASYGQQTRLITKPQLPDLPSDIRPPSTSDFRSKVGRFMV